MLECEMRNGHPWSVGGMLPGPTGEDAALLADLTAEEQEKVLDWIRTMLKPTRTPYKDRTSYGIKHILEQDTGIYVSNNQFKDAMLVCGFTPIKINELNWVFCICRNSPAFKR